VPAAVLTLLALAVCVSRPLWAIYGIVIAASLIDFHSLVVYRLTFAGIPIDILDVAFAICGISLLASALRHQNDSSKSRLSVITNLFLLALGLAMALAVIRGLTEQQALYSLVRSLRPFVVLVLVLMLSRQVVTNDRAIRNIVLLILAGGAISLLLSTATRLAFILSLTSPLPFLQARNALPTTAALDVAIIAPFAAIATRALPWRHLLAVWVGAISVLFFCLISFQLTLVFAMVLIPAACLALSWRTRSRAIIGLVAVLGGAGTLSLLQSFTFGADNPFANLLAQITSQAWNLNNNPNFQGRVISWVATLNRLDGLGWVMGMGLGYRDIIETNVPGIGSVFLGEPTASTLLLTTGLFGITALLGLQLWLTYLSIRDYTLGVATYWRVWMLIAAVYGVFLCVYSFVHNNFLAPQSLIIFAVLLAISERGWGQMRMPSSSLHLRSHRESLLLDFKATAREPRGVR
jgi:hypothetical protein